MRTAAVGEPTVAPLITSLIIAALLAPTDGSLSVSASQILGGLPGHQPDKPVTLCLDSGLREKHSFDFLIDSKSLQKQGALDHYVIGKSISLTLIIFKFIPLFFLFTSPIKREKGKQTVYYFD